MNEFNTVQKLQAQTGLVVQGKMIQNLRKNDSVASGNLLRSIKVNNVENQGTFTTIVTTGVDYANWVDEGTGDRGPGKQPPIAPIEAWIKRKSIAIPQQLSIKSFAFAIAKKIAKNGQNKRPYPYIKPAIRFGDEFFERRINEALGTDVEIDLNIILDSSPYLKPVR
jgi:hypothetical protein